MTQWVELARSIDNCHLFGDPPMRFKRSLLAVVLAFVIGTVAAAGEFDGPLTIIVPAGSGSAPDIIARLIGEELRTRLGQTVIVDDRPGAGGIVAVMAAKTANSQNTLLLAQAAVVVVTPLTYRAAKYDLERDMEVVAVIADTPMLFVAHPTNGPKTLAEAIAQAKAKPGLITLSSPSRASIPHLAGELLGQATGTRFNSVPMNNSGQAVQAIVNGDSLVSVDGIAPLLPLVKAGRVRALAVTSARTLPGLEAFPLAKETVPGLEATGWFMLFARKGTPPARVKALNDAINAALKSPEVIQKLLATANYPVGGGVAEARAFLVRERRLWASAVERAGMKPD